MEYARVAISVGLAIGVALSATILWAETYWQLVFRFLRAFILTAIMVSLPIWYLFVATFINALISGVT